MFFCVVVFLSSSSPSRGSRCSVPSQLGKRPLEVLRERVPIPTAFAMFFTICNHRTKIPTPVLPPARPPAHTCPSPGGGTRRGSCDAVSEACAVSVRFAQSLNDDQELGGGAEGEENRNGRGIFVFLDSGGSRSASTT